AAAGRDVPVRDLDDPDPAGRHRRLAQREAPHALVVDPVTQDLAVLPYDAVRGALEPLDRAPVDLAAIGLDRAALLAEMGRHGGLAQLALERGRENVLSGVLLHGVEAAGPVDLGLDLGGRGRAGIVDHVPHATGLVGLHVEHPGRAQPAVVGLLAAALGIE